MNYRSVLRPGFIKKRLNDYRRLLPTNYNKPIFLLVLDMAISFFRYRCTVKDYIIYEFYKLNHYGRDQFFTGGRADRWYDKNNDPILMDELKNKEKTLCKFASYIDRDWCGPNVHGEEDFAAFQKKHEKAILKPLDDCGGHGIQVVNLQDCSIFPGGAYGSIA